MNVEFVAKRTGALEGALEVEAGGERGAVVAALGALVDVDALRAVGVHFVAGVADF